MAMPEPFGMKVDKYLPEEINVWMYAMVAIGSAFVVFVIISVYLMCHTPDEPGALPASASASASASRRPAATKHSFSDS
ncbi:uncharacterized protein [Penaeus vannamei]|uniref:uncharacterized protein isoform X3 n=1 Tax=Penaeus vannamei TaxID=6689 RepID=UPI00387F5ED3